MATADRSEDARFVLAAGETLCLDYANTRYWRGSEAPTEALGAFGDLLDWLACSTGLPASIIAAARDWARHDAAGAQAAFDEAVETREAIYRIFAAVAEGEPVPEHELARLNQALAAAPARRHVARLDGGYGWEIALAEIDPPKLLAPILWSASELLLNAGQRRIRRCANDRCLWLFLDTSKSGTRRWCDMSSCGNRAKAARHYAKVKAR